MAQHLLGLREVAVPAVDHTERVVAADQRRVLQHRLARPPVGVVEAAERQRLGRAVAHVHRHDRLFLQLPGPLAAQILLRQEVDRQHFRRQGAEGGFAQPPAETQVDVVDDELQVAAAAQVSSVYTAL